MSYWKGTHPNQLILDGLWGVYGVDSISLDEPYLSARYLFMDLVQICACVYREKKWPLMYINPPYLRRCGLKRTLCLARFLDDLSYEDMLEPKKIEKKRRCYKREQERIERVLDECILYIHNLPPRW